VELLLDTHILLWWLSDDSCLTSGARGLIRDPANVVFVSATTAWEITIKQNLGKLRFEGDLESVLGDEGFTPLAISVAHAIETGHLPPIQQDPFDRMLVAQSRVENLNLLSADSRVLQYPANTIDCR
jgi:PIN domain nuclease of toxin-antitoxin system